MSSDAPGGEPHELAHLRAEARHARERLALYRAKAYGMRETSPVRMRELERNAAATAERLAAALRAAGLAAEGGAVPGDPAPGPAPGDPAPGPAPGDPAPGDAPRGGPGDDGPPAR